MEFSSAYYDPDDENVPKYIRYLFEQGAPADFTLIGATSRDPGDISTALKSRCTAVYFHPLTPPDIIRIVEDAAGKLQICLEEGVARSIAHHTTEGRQAVGILSDAYSLAVYQAGSLEDLTVGLNQVQRVMGTSRMTPFEVIREKPDHEVGRIYGLALQGFVGSTIEIEAMAFKAQETGKGTLRFNDTAGSMAKDSVFNAASAIRNLTGLELKDYDIHINVLGGANIDGPSAGAAITLALLSALENSPLPQDLAITGEISLKGRLKGVGGIQEKVYGAIRKGITTIIIPKANEGEVPRDIGELEIISCETMGEVRDIVYDKVK